VILVHVIKNGLYVTLTPTHSGPEERKKMDKLITFFPKHIFSNPIQE
jgi:hypothetical protein